MTKTILLIDDERIFNFIAQKLIIGLGVEARILVAENGQQGLDMIQEHARSSGSAPQLILVDFYMSPMDGVTFVKTFYSLNIPGKEQTHVALTTSAVLPADIELAKSSGAQGFLAKPIVEIELSKLLKEAGIL